MRFSQILVILFISTTCFAQITFEKTYGDNTDQIGSSVIQTHDKGYIIAGTFGVSSGYGDPPYKDLFVLRIDEQGDSLWSKRYLSNVNCYGFQICETNDNGYVILGSVSEISGTPDAVLLKINNIGDSIWLKTYDGFYSTSMQSTSDGGFILGGHKGFNLYVIKTNANGDIIWNKTIQDDFVQSVTSIVETEDKGFVLSCPLHSGI